MFLKQLTFWNEIAKEIQFHIALIISLNYRKMWEWFIVNTILICVKSLTLDITFDNT